MTRTFHCVKHKLYTFQTSVSLKQMFWLGALIPFHLCCFWFPIAVSFLSTPLPLPTLVPTHWPHTHTRVMVAGSQLAGGGYFSCSICMCGWLLLLCDWLSCWQCFWPGYTLWHYFSSRRLMGWLSYFVLPDTIFQYSLFFSLRQSWLCGCLLMMFAQLQAFLSLYIAVKGTVVCRYLYVYSCSAVLGYVPPTSCLWICFCVYTCACIVLWPPDFVSMSVPMCIYSYWYVHLYSLYTWICVFVNVNGYASFCAPYPFSIYRKNYFKSITKVAKSNSRHVKIL